jgi:hypothetical protein
MKRRDFIKVTGLGDRGRRDNCRTRDRPINAGTEMAHDGELAEIA